MTDLPWLVPASGPGPDRSRAERTERATRDLAAVAADLDGYLVLHEAVDIAFAFEARHLPAGTIDLRDGDPLAIALADPAAVVVSGAGIYIGTPIERDPRWAQLADLGRTRALLVSSALSGAYLGCTVYGARPGLYLDGLAEQVVGVAARLVYPDGSVLVIERTTVGYRSEGIGERRRAQAISSIVQAVPGIPTQVTSELLDADELAAVLAEADRLPPRSLTLNGRRWTGRPG